MSTLSDEIKAILPCIRSIPFELGFRPYEVFVRVYDNEHLPWDDDFDNEEPTVYKLGHDCLCKPEDGYVANPNVIQLSTRKFDLSEEPDADIRIGPLLPTDELLSLLDPQVYNTRLVFTIIGPNFNNANFTITSIESYRTTRIMLFLKRVSKGDV
jgi:hypothetical protein